MWPVTTVNDRAALVRRVLVEDGRAIRDMFLYELAEFVDDFVSAMSFALQASGGFDEFARDNESHEKIGWFIFSAVQGHLISMRLFLDGFLVQSGNAQRQVLESIAMAILCSKSELNVLERFNEDKYSSNKAIRDLIRNAKVLGVNRNAIEEIRKGAEFYHDFSHPSKMTIALYQSDATPDASYVGSIYDRAKLEQYRIEANCRVKIANIFPNFISGVKRNLESAT